MLQYESIFVKLVWTEFFLSCSLLEHVLSFGAKYILDFTPNGENGEIESGKMLGCSLSYTKELEINPEFWSVLPTGFSL